MKPSRLAIAGILTTFTLTLQFTNCSKGLPDAAENSLSSSGLFSISANPASVGISGQSQISTTGGTPPIRYDVLEGGGIIDQNGLLSAPSSSSLVRVRARDGRNQEATINVEVGRASQAQPNCGTVTPGSQTFSTPGNASFTVPCYHSLTVTLWGGGGGGGSGFYGGASAGGSGGASAFGAILSASGGLGGAASGSVPNLGGAGGQGRGGTANATGEAGGPGTINGSVYSGAGGAAPNGGAGGPSLSMVGRGPVGGEPGGGGSGGCLIYSGGGGGGGGYAQSTFAGGQLPVGSQVTITVGNGGAGGASAYPGGSGAKGRVTITWN